MPEQSGMDEDLVDVLAARSGLVCLVGAGGKKTTLYRLASAHGGKVGITATVHIPPFPRSFDAHKIITEASDLLEHVVEAASTKQRVAFALPSTKPGRLAGLEPSEVVRIHAAAGFHVTLIKADGARARWVKAPCAREPRVPKTASTVIPVVSARAIGEPLSERITHRVELVAALTGARPGEVITPEHIARLLSSENGALKDVGDARVVPLINMVDNLELQGPAREAAERALALSDRFDRVVLARMQYDDALVDVITR